MKRILKNTILVALLALPSIYACSQIPAPPLRPAVPPQPGITPPPDGSGRPDDQPIRTLSTIRGSVGSYIANDRNEYDGFSLTNSGQTITIQFAPHEAARLMAAVKPGSTVIVQGFYQATPDNSTALHLVTLTVDGQTFYETAPAEQTVPPTTATQAFDGTISDLHRDRSGTPNGILLSGNRLIEIPPSVYDQLQSYLKPGTKLSGSGIFVTPPPGVVLAQNIHTIHPQTLTLNGQTYMVR